MLMKWPPGLDRDSLSRLGSGPLSSFCTSQKGCFSMEAESLYLRLVSPRIITLGWNPITENPRGLFSGILPACYTHPRHRDKSTILLQRVYYVPKKVHHSLLHTSVGECSLACIYNNEVETSHTASQNPQSSWDMQQCNVSSAGGRRG